MSIGLCGRRRGGRGGGPGGDRSLLSSRTGRRGSAVRGFDRPGQTGRHTGCCCGAASGDGGDRFGLSLKPRAADEVMPLPVFMLAEGAAVAGSIAATARLASFAPTVPATLLGRSGGGVRKIWCKSLRHNTLRKKHKNAKLA